MSYSSTSEDLSDKSVYPFFTRMCTPDSLQTNALVVLCSFYGWRSIAVLASTDSYSVDLAHAFAEQFENNATQIVAFESFNEE